MKPSLLYRLGISICFLALSGLGSKLHAQTPCIPTFSFGCSFASIVTGDDINTFTITGTGSTSINDVATGCSGGYDDRSAESVTFSPGGTYNGTINSTSDLAGSGENMQIFIDFNDNGTFETSESVGGLSAIDIAPSTSPFTITIPAGSTTGSHRMRVVLCSISDAAYPSISPCAYTDLIVTTFPYNYGEVHDYTAVISTSSSTCGVPTSLAASSVTTTSAILNWSEPVGSVGSEYVVTATPGTPTGSGTQTTALTYSPTGLTPSTVYYASVRDSCGPTSLSAWVTITFTTTATTTTTCNPVTGLSASAITTSSATISWTAVSGSIGYLWVVDNSVTAPATGGTYTTLTTANVSGLTAGTTYYAHVRDSCGPGNESGWVTIPFTTLTVGGCNAVTSLTATSITSNSAIVNWTMASGVSWAEYVIDMTAADPVGAGTANNASTYSATGLTAATTYYAHVRDSCGATSLSAWVTIPFTTLSPTGFNVVTPIDFNIAAFPNPVKDELTIRIDGATAKGGLVQLMDLSGKQIKTVIADMNVLNINMSGLPSGIYFVRYIDAGHTQTIKISKQ